MKSSAGGGVCPSGIAMAALKFNDLIHDIKSDYIFDSDAVTQFEGRTGPYILYTAVRLNAVLSKGSDNNCAMNAANCELHIDERNLLLGMLDFQRTVQNAFDKRAPDILANYVYELCQLTNTFYHNCPILKDDVDAPTRAHRLQIVAKVHKTLATAIDLMGLKIPEEM